MALNPKPEAVNLKPPTRIPYENETQPQEGRGEAPTPADEAAEGILHQKRLVGAKRRLAELTSPPASPDPSAAGTWVTGREMNVGGWG